MAIVKVQSTTASADTIQLTSVAAGNMLALFTSYFRPVPTGLAEATPTDSNGTWANGQVPVPAAISGNEVGTSIFYLKSANAGTHTVTPQLVSGRNYTLVEFSALDTTAPLDVGTTAKTENSNPTSQVTGTTGITGQNDELVLIGLGGAALAGSSDIGFTDPVSGFTTLQKVSNHASDVATFHAFKVISSIGTQAATFNWTDNESGQSFQAVIATFKAAAVAASSAPMFRGS